MEAGARWTLPAARAGVNRTLYLFAGAGLRANGAPLANGRAFHVRPDVEVALTNGEAASELLLLQGRPIAESIAKHGPFVMNTRQEIEQAYADFRRTQFGGWPWPGADPVHAREDRFARHADGRVERPA
jgi:redox-sensitive bicupin YhaK (pirin superfamily)